MVLRQVHSYLRVLQVSSLESRMATTLPSPARRVLALSSLAAASCLHPGSPDGKSTSLFLLLVLRTLLIHQCRVRFACCTQQRSKALTPHSFPRLSPPSTQTRIYYASGKHWTKTICPVKKWLPHGMLVTSYRSQRWIIVKHITILVLEVVTLQFYLRSFWLRLDRFPKQKFPRNSNLSL